MNTLSRRRLLELGGKVAITGSMLSVLSPCATSSAHTAPVHGTKRFQVGTYLKLRRYRSSAGGVVQSGGYLGDAWFQDLGLLPIDVVYSSRFVDGNGPTATLNAEKLRAIAREANAVIPVSLDAEVWDKNRFGPHTPTPNGKSIVQNLVEVVRTFKQANPAVRVGLYSEVPQSTYGFNDSTASAYDKLNPQYAAVAAVVDYYSPELYNRGYDGTQEGDQLWLRAAQYAVHACKQLDGINRTEKPVLPYLSPGWTDRGRNPRYLSYEQMHFRLAALERLGASGCILWLSSGAKEPGSDESLILDPNSGWMKAAVEFARSN